MFGGLVAICDGFAPRQSLSAALRGGLAVCSVLFVGGHVLVAQSESVQLYGAIHLRPGLLPNQRITAVIDATNPPQACLIYSELTGRTLLPRSDGLLKRLNESLGGRLTRWHLIKLPLAPDSGLRYHADGRFSAGELKENMEGIFDTSGLAPVAVGNNCFRLAKKEIKKRGLDSPAAARR
jgi:hypothetical protein